VVGEWEEKHGKLAPGRTQQESTEAFSVKPAKE
jgi:hypothetical protein